MHADDFRNRLILLPKPILPASRPRPPTKAVNARPQIIAAKGRPSAVAASHGVDVRPLAAPAPGPIDRKTLGNGSTAL
jgi:hypothetical protein